MNYHVRCQHCRYSRPNLGRAKLTAETLAASHGLKKHHLVKVWAEANGLVVLTQFHGPETPGQLDMFDQPPF